MIIAVYALDAEGNSKVYTQEITIPEPEITGQVVVSIDVPKDKIKMRALRLPLRQMPIVAGYMWDNRVQA